MAMLDSIAALVYPPILQRQRVIGMKIEIYIRLHNNAAGHIIAVTSSLPRRLHM